MCVHLLFLWFHWRYLFEQSRQRLHTFSWCQKNKTTQLPLEFVYLVFFVRDRFSLIQSNFQINLCDLYDGCVFLVGRWCGVAIQGFPTTRRLGTLGVSVWLNSGVPQVQLFE